jgi:hypothetical protein
MLVAGRPRENGARYPSGKLRPRKTSKPDIEPISPALWGRIKTHGKQLCLDPRLSTELGRLALHGELTAAMVVAGFRVAEIYGRYEGFKRLRRSPKSPSYNASYGEAGVAEELLGAQQIEDLERRIREATRSVELLEAEIPHNLRGPVQDLCVSSQPISPAIYEDIRQLLQRLAIGWHLHGAPRGDAATPGRNGRHGPALHFNKHEEAPEAVTVAIPTPESPKKPNYDRIYFIEILCRENPQIDSRRAAELYDETQARKQRELFRAAKAKRSIVALRAQ